VRARRVLRCGADAVVLDDVHPSGRAADPAGGVLGGEGGSVNWSDDARRIVTATLAALPADADAKAARRALRDAYPWGGREYWPYKAWCAATKAAIEVRFPPPAKPPCDVCGGRGWVTLDEHRGSAPCHACGPIAVPRALGGRS